MESIHSFCRSHFFLMDKLLYIFDNKGKDKKIDIIISNKSLITISAFLSVYKNWDLLKHPQSCNVPFIKPIVVFTKNTINRKEINNAVCLKNIPVIRNIPAINSIHGKIMTVGFMRNSGSIV